MGHSCSGTEGKHPGLESSSCVHYIDDCLEALRKAGCRITRQRMAVIDCLAHANSPLSAPDLYEQLSQSDESDSLDRASVYRALDTLLELDLVHRVPLTGAYLACKHQSCKKFHHVLYRCTQCEKVQELDVPNEVVAPLLFHLKESLNVTPDTHLLHMDGLCKACSKEQ
jgi:Fe2+ or Zn2+ uptake regulation protein